MSADLNCILRTCAAAVVVLAAAASALGQPPPGFGQVEDQPVPGFGTDEGPSVEVESEDMRKAEEVVRRFDRNRNGTLEPSEAADGDWYDRLFDYDRNKDNRISVQEMAQRYALRRLRREQEHRSADEQRREQERARIEAERRRREEEEQRRRAEEERQRQFRAISRETWGLAIALLQRYDTNRDGMLDPAEARPLGLDFAQADADGRGRIDRGEFGLWLHQRVSHPGQDVLRRLPDWFVARDLDGDGQVVMAEFADEWTELKAAEFEQYDANGDGIITSKECLETAEMFGGALANNRLKLIPVRGTVYSYIHVQDTDPIGDLNVQLSITHTYDSALDGFLIAPDGERIELFTAVGESDDHFRDTIFDDEATRPITQGRPPFEGRYQPEAVAKHQISLKDFYGKSIAGTWTLMIRATRSDRPGALHGWSLITRPMEAEPPKSDLPETGPPGAERPEADLPETGRSETASPETGVSETDTPGGL